eukprot:m.296587 g.296587  ORF g.296587 m.296587 type:complete len:2279 (-) comp15857_c0_seq1:170-7006(-)
MAKAAATPRFLVLESGEVFEGIAFGATTCAVGGEVVFQTGMVGYPEALSDPSYCQQILVLTYPIVGSYGVPCIDKCDEHGIPLDFESSRVQAAALVVGQYVDEYSHWNATQSLSEWMASCEVPGIAGIDTRHLTILLRERGVVRGWLTDDKQAAPITADMSNLVMRVSTKEPRIINPTGSPKVLAFDCGIKNSQLRHLVQRGACVKVVPWDYDFINQPEGQQFDFERLFLSNGPGDPTDCAVLIERLTTFLESQQDNPSPIPIFGICLGHQLLSLAIGATTYKMKYGNRGHNLPCHMVGTDRCFITSQNHGYAVDHATLPQPWAPLFQNVNDNTNEGIYNTTKPYFTSQFHPEARAGPQDTEFLFDLFIKDTFHTYLETMRSSATSPVAAKSLEPNANLLSNPDDDLDSSTFSTTTPASISTTTTTKYRKVLIIGSGSLCIGQSGEFDYSGSQALKAYKQAGLKTILINPNIATVQTSPGFADKVYFLPILPEYVLKVIKVERPDCITVSFGGQTALNCGVELYKQGVFDQYSVAILGTDITSVMLTEDRQLFKEHLASVGETTIESVVADTREAAVEAATKIGFPVLVRAAYALGGLGSGFANNRKELDELLNKAFSYSSQVIVDRSLRGWKEVEYEVVRDQYDNCICVCNMENFDPLGVHTGESIVVAPSQTLDDQEYHMLRTTALKVIRSLKIVGECNIQYALDPVSRNYCIVEVNARLSRSSALASKATGYPLAYVAAWLSLGESLISLTNSITRTTTACFEPSLDYCAVKVPRWDLRKFPRASRLLDSSMKSVGEAMAISRTFEEAFQKALRMANEDVSGFVPNHVQCEPNDFANPSDTRVFGIASALYNNNLSVAELQAISKIDNWFLYKLNAIIALQKQLEAIKTLDAAAPLLRSAKQFGFSDEQLALCLNTSKHAVRSKRGQLGVTPIVKQIDTVAAEFPCFTNYLYTTYNAQEHDVTFDNHTTLVLGSGVYKIGSSVEFDWCAVNCVRELRKLGHHTTMINCNPETVSTDYDEGDRLYFDEVTFEVVMDIYTLENPRGIVLSMGGQLPNNIAIPLHHQRVKVIGTSPSMIDNAENRFKFSRLLDSLQVDQPSWKELTSIDEAKAFCERVGYPCLIRPSYVLSGAAMNVAYSDADLLQYLGDAVSVSKDYPVVISKFVQDAKEIEVDAVAQEGQVIVMAVSEHVENAGIHSGDATLIHPPQDLTDTTVKRIRSTVRQIAKGLHIHGPFNMQFIAKDNKIMVIECNLRVSRTFPFVSKTRRQNLVAIATRAMLGLDMSNVEKPIFSAVGVKAPQFSFSRLKGADFSLGVEMVSTGEVACYGRDQFDAYLKAMQATDIHIPAQGSNILLSIGSFKQRTAFLESARKLVSLGYKLFGTSGTSDFYRENGLEITELPFRSPEGSSSREDIISYLVDKRFDLAINMSRKNKVSSSASALISEPTRGYHIRRTAVDSSVPIITDEKVAKLFTRTLERFHEANRNIWVDTAIDCLKASKPIRLPGLIDVHVHLREPGGEYKEDWDTGTKAALAGGFTMVCVMPNTSPAIVNDQTLDDVKALAGSKAHCDFACFVGANSDNHDTLYKSATKAAALKMYLNQTYGPLLLEKTTDWMAHIRAWPLGRPICVHAEAKTLPAVLHLANLCNKPIHVCHVARREEIEVIKYSKLAGQKVTCEVAPHHLFLTEQSFTEGSIDSWGAVKPPLVTNDDQQSLWDNMDIIDCFATDHAPHTPEDKEKCKCPGFPGLETALPLLLTAVKDGRLTLDDIVAKCHDNPLRIFGLEEQPNTYIEVDLEREWTIPKSMKYTKCGWTPFEGMKVTGSVERVVLRGKVVYVDGEILSYPGYGIDMRPCATTSVPAAVGADGDGDDGIVSPPPDRTIDLKVEEMVVSGRVSPASVVEAQAIQQQQKLQLEQAAQRLQQQLPSSPTRPRSPTRPIAKVGMSTAVSASATATATEAPTSHLSSITSVLSVHTFNRQMIRALCMRADELRYEVEHTRGGLNNLRGCVLGSIFYEASTRTRCSFTAAMKRLGGEVVEISSSDASTSKGESFSDFVRCIACYTDAIVVRNSSAGSLQPVDGLVPVPLINAGDGVGEHPTQSLLDVYTIRRERGTVNGLTITMVGDLKHGRTVHSLAMLLSLYNVTLRYVSPPSLQMPEDVQSFINGRCVEQTSHTSLIDLIPDTDVLYMTRIQRERFASEEEYSQHASFCCLEPSMLAKAKQNLVVMHPLPRVDEIHPDVDSDPRAAYFRQMENGLYMRMALLDVIFENLGKKQESDAIY